MSNEIVTAGSYYSDQFEFTNRELRQHVKLANQEIDNVKDKVNELVVIVYDDNKDWSLKKICDYIAGKNDDLEEYGFSAKTIMRYLDEQNRQLIDKRKQRQSKQQPSLKQARQGKGTIIQNNVTEQSGDTCPQNVPEHSSIPMTEPQITEQEADEILKDVELEDGSKIEFDQLPKPVLRFAKMIELSPTKIELIAKQSKKTILKEHPQIQKQLVEAIAPLTIDQAKHTIFQKIRDLENGYLKLEGDHYVKGDSKHREIVEGGDKVLEPIQVAHMDITKSINEFLFRMTDRSLTKGEFEYSKDIVKNTKDYRLSVIKVANKRTLALFEDYFILVSDISLEMLELIQQEFDSRDMKKDLEMQ